MNISRRTMEMLTRAHMYAASFNFTFIGTEHILLALTDESMSPVDEILDRHGVSKTDVMREVAKLAGREPGALVEREAPWYSFHNLLDVGAGIQTALKFERTVL